MNKRSIRKLDHAIEQIIGAYNNFLTLTEIAEIYGVTAPTISKLLKRYRVKRRKRGPLSYSQMQIAKKTKEKFYKED